MVVDTHCHLDLTADRGIATEGALTRAAARGVTDIVQIAVDVGAADRARKTIEEFAGRNDCPRLFYTAGVHPESVSPELKLSELTDYVANHQAEEGFVAIGETGLDYFHTTEHAQLQRESLSLHFELAKQYDLPVVLHLRDSQHYDGTAAAPRDAIELLDKQPGVIGVLHCFTYGYAEAEPFLQRGWFVSYSGIVTFRNAKAVQEGAVRVPLSQLLVETDAPFLAPMPYRGKTNEPAYVADTLDFLANLRAERCGEDPDLVRQTIFENSQRFIEHKRNHAAKSPTKG